MIEKHDLYFPFANENRKLHIHLPDDYNFSAERYPVMYMFDGHNLYYDSDATYGKSWGFKEFLDHWPKKIIVVGMECSHHGHDRLSEYSPYFWASGWAGDVVGHGEETMQWIINTVKPFIDSKYRTWPHREATGIGGSSMGGLMSVYAAICHNGVFSKAACVSSAIGFCGKELRAAIDSTDLNPDTKVFLSWGALEGNGRHRMILNSCNKSLNDRLYKKGVQPYLFRQENGNHCEADWEKQVPLFMNWLWL